MNTALWKQPRTLVEDDHPIVLPNNGLQSLNEARRCLDAQMSGRSCTCRRAAAAPSAVIYDDKYPLWKLYVMDFMDSPRLQLETVRHQVLSLVGVLGLIPCRHTVKHGQHQFFHFASSCFIVHGLYLFAQKIHKPC